MKKTMRALVKFGNNDGEVEIRELPVPEIGPGDVLLETGSVGVCGWDIEMWRHKMANPVKVPVVQGHEFCGTIVACGSEIDDFKPGDRVVCETSAVVCGKCAMCMSGNYQLCASRKGFGYGVDGAFADYVKVRRGCLHRLPDTVSFDHGCLTEPACVAYHALVKNSRILPGDTVVILGPGPVGLMSLQVAKICNAGKIIVVGTGRSKIRLDAAKKLGADRIINSSETDPLDAIMSETRGEGAPLVVDAAGNSATLALSLKAVARLGQITKIGWGPKPAACSLDPLLSKGARLQGSFSHNWGTWERVISLIGSGDFDMETMISHRIDLAQWHETFEDIEAGRGIKAVVQMKRE